MLATCLERMAAGLEGLAQVLRRVGSRRTAATLRHKVIQARRRGLFPTGRPRSLDPRRVAELRAAGLGATAIANELGVARSSIYRKLKEIEAPETRRLKPQAASPNCSDASRA